MEEEHSKGKWAKTMNRHLMKEIQVASKYTKLLSTSLVTE